MNSEVQSLQTLSQLKTRCWACSRKPAKTTRRDCGRLRRRFVISGKRVAQLCEAA